jgi:hypothetical protein
MENNEDADFGIKSPIQAFLDFYKDTPKQIKMLDSLIALSLVLSLLQLAYYILGGKNPFEAFVAGLFCTLGIMVLTGIDISSFSQAPTRRR